MKTVKINAKKDASLIVVLNKGRGPRIYDDQDFDGRKVDILEFAYLWHQDENPVTLSARVNKTDWIEVSTSDKIVDCLRFIQAITDCEVGEPLYTGDQWVVAFDIDEHISFTEEDNLLHFIDYLLTFYPGAV